MFNLLKFFTGFNIFNGEKLGKLVFYFILIAIGIGIYHKTFVAKTTTTIIQRPEQVTIRQNGGKKAFTLFVEPYVDQSSNRKFGTGVRGGIRLEW